MESSALSALSALRERLHAAALAGAALCPEDAQLAQARDALAPLEAAAPVFRRLGDLVRALCAPACEGRAAVLLEALTLTDALACTQAAVAVSGTVEPMPLAARGGEVADIPYSLLHLLREIEERSVRRWHSPTLRPEIFHEFRLAALLRWGLAAGTFCAREIVEWLAEEGANLLPLLEDGFDPDGGKGMVWLVRMLSETQGAKANGVYCAQLDKGGSPAVRTELIYALRHDKGNLARLLELCRTEKGKPGEMARWVLARMDEPEVWAYFRTLLPKRPRQVMVALEFACGGQEAGELVAKELERLLAPLVADASRVPDTKHVNALQEAFSALPGKTGPAVCEAFRRMAALGTALDDRLYLKRKRVRSGTDFRSGRPFSKAVAFTMREAILRRPDEGLTALAEELSRTASLLFSIPCLTGMLLLRPAAEAYETAKRLLAGEGFAQGSLTGHGEQILLDVFMEIEVSWPRHELSYGYVAPGYDNLWSENGQKGYYDLEGVFQPVTAETWIAYLERHGCRGFLPSWSSEVTKRSASGLRPFAEPLDFRWLEAMTASGKSLPAGSMCRLAFQLLDLGNPQHCERMARIFETWMERTHDDLISRDIPIWLACCGKRDLRGLLQKFFRRNGIDRNKMDHMSFTMRYIAPDIFPEEMETCLDLLRRGELRLTHSSEEKTIYADAEKELDEFRRFVAARSRKSKAGRQ